MATIRYGPIIGDARGSFGGAIASRCPSGAVLRNYALHRAAVPKSSPTRCTFAYLRHSWRTQLTNEQRLAWQAAAAGTVFTNSIGNSYHPSGFLLFLKHSMICSDHSTPTVICSPPFPLTILPGVNTWTQNEGAQNVSLVSPLGTIFPGTTLTMTCSFSQTFRALGSFSGDIWSPHNPTWDPALSQWTHTWSLASADYGHGPWLWFRVHRFDSAGRIGMESLMKFYFTTY